MNRTLIWIAVLFVGSAVGCQGSGQRFNPLIGYGVPRIPAPATGSYGVPSNQPVNPADPYYGAPRPGGTGTTISPNTPTTTSTQPISGARIADRGLGSPSGWRPAGQRLGQPITAPSSSGLEINTGSQVVPATFNAPATSNQDNQSLRPATNANAGTVSVSQRIQQQRMHTNDATNVRAPERFIPGNQLRRLTPPGVQQPVAAPRILPPPPTAQLQAVPVTSSAVPRTVAATTQLPTTRIRGMHSPTPAYTQPVIAEATTVPQPMQASAVETASVNPSLGWRQRDRSLTAQNLKFR